MAVLCPGIRVLDGPLTDSLEAVAFNKHYQVNDIYSCRFPAWRHVFVPVWSVVVTNMLIQTPVFQLGSRR